MGRLLLSVLLLAAFAVAFASASPVRPEKAHGHAPAKPGSQGRTRPTARKAHAAAHEAHSRPASRSRAAWHPQWRAAGHGSHRAVMLRRASVSSMRKAALSEPAVERRTAEEPTPPESANSNPIGTGISNPPPPIAEEVPRPADATAHVSALGRASAPGPVGEPETDSAAEPKTVPESSTGVESSAVGPKPAPESNVMPGGKTTPEPIAGPIPDDAPEEASLRIPRHLPPPLFGSHESLVRQNEKTEAEGLERIQDSADLNDRIARKLLVPVPASAALTVNPGLQAEFRYCRPWTAKFLANLARAHDAVFHRPIVVSSAVRTVAYQKQLERVNGNAAPAEGDIVSPHLTGASIDLAKAGLPRDELAWMRAWLAPLQTAGKIDVEEEFQQACFHITVYESYVPAQPTAKPRTRRRPPSVANALATKAM
jgi:hypothetical protein